MAQLKWFAERRGRRNTGALFTGPRGAEAIQLQFEILEGRRLLSVARESLAVKTPGDVGAEQRGLFDQADIRHGARSGFTIIPDRAAEKNSVDSVPVASPAVVVISGNGNTNAASLLAAGGPGDPSLPGFGSVGKGSTTNSSVTYLGAGWVITASHVNIDNNVGPVTFGASTYAIDMSSIHVLHNPDNTLADLKIFQIVGNPALPAVLPSSINVTPPSGQVYMVGNGLSLGAQHFWSVNTSQNPWVWTDGPAPPVPGPNDASGYDVVSPRTIRWGENTVQQTNLVVNLGGGVFIHGFTTQFDSLAYTGMPALTHEAQASSGDSGGAVFSFVGGQWVLSGIMIAISSPLSGQPNSTVVFGYQTLIADLSVYRNEILSIATLSSVTGRQLFYNQSKFDGNSASVNASDDLAIAIDKTAYLPGSGATTFANISSYSRGINGILVDISGSHPGITASDFTFKVGSNNTPSTWVAAPAPLTVSVRAGAGVSGADRVEIIWANGAINNTWLEVSVAADANTGLASPDIFFFGNRIGDIGTGTSASAITNASDEIAARGNQGIGATLTNLFDFDRSGIVNAVDAIISRNNIGTLVKINVSNPPATPVATPALASSRMMLEEASPASFASLLTSTWLVNPVPPSDSYPGSVPRVLQRWVDETIARSRASLGGGKIAHELGLDIELLDRLAEEIVGNDPVEAELNAQ